MKKLFIMSSLVLAALSSSVHAQVLTGALSVSTAVATVSNGYPDAKIQTAAATFEVSRNTKIGFNLASINAWGDTATYAGATVSQEFNEGFGVTAGVGASDKGKITAHQRVNVMGNYKTLEQKNLILGAGVDYYTMRDGGSSTSVVTQVVYYVPTMPLVLQGNAVLSQSSVNARQGTRFGVAATYGQVGAWTATAAYSTGRVNYELLRSPGAIADYNSTSFSVGGNYWIDKNWGLNLELSRVDNRYYTRDGLQAGAFWNF